MRKARLMVYLDMARDALRRGHAGSARIWLGAWRIEYDKAPAGTKRRWRCGQ